MSWCSRCESVCVRPGSPDRHESIPQFLWYCGGSGQKKGGTDRPRLFDALTDGSDYFDVLSLGAFLTLGDFELHFLAFDQGFEARA